MKISTTTGGTTSVSRRRRLPSAVVSALLAVALSGVGLVALASPAAAVPLTEVGPVDYATGFPFWYGDGGDAQQGIDPLRLELCVDEQQDPLCSVVGNRPNPGQPLSVPENFPNESFYWSGDATIQTTAGVKARLVLGQEGAFGGVGAVAVGQQVAFSRLRIRIDGVPNGSTYHVVTPYGERDVTADKGGRVFVTEDRGCLAAPCDFAAGLNGEVGPFLRWDSGAPAGYVGDPAVTHTVTGSPTGDNFFRVEGPNIGGPGVNSIQTDQFTVQGRIAQPRATVDLPGDLYALGTQVEITPSFPGESDVVYTTDGSDPLTSGTATTFTSTADVPAATVTLPDQDGDLTLKYAVRYDGQTSQVYSQDYSVRGDLSVVSATPAPAVSPDRLVGRQDVELSAATNGVPTQGAIYYTTDGTRPRLDAAGSPVGTTRTFTSPIPITRTTVLTALSVPDPTDAVPDPGPQPISRFHYTVHNLDSVSTARIDGYPDTLTDIGLPTGPGKTRQDPVELELCLDDPLCPVVGTVPDPTRGISFPDNFPTESFWWSGESRFTAGGIDARLNLGLEAAFDTPGVQPGHQIAFGRIRVRLGNAVPGATYEVVEPYGVIRAAADDTGRLSYTDDNGCLGAPCGFDRLLTQPVGPVLRWDSGAPAGYVGDPAVAHTVTGSPYDTNEFTVTQVTDGAGNPITPQAVGSSDLFTVQGKLAGPDVMADWQTGTFGHPLQVTLTGNSRTTQIRYTLDGSTPTATTGQVYDGPIAVGEGVTTLNYVGVAADGATSTMETETYTVDTTAPVLSVSPAEGVYDTAQDVSLSTDDPAATIRYTLDGSAPDASSTLYTGVPIHVASSLTLQAIATDPLGNSSSDSWSFTIVPPPPADAPPTPGFSLARTTSGVVNAGGAATLSGVLAPQGQAIAGAKITLQGRAVTTTGQPLAADWTDIGAGTTATDGGFAFTGLQSQAAQEYRAVYSGDPAGAIVSASQQVTVRAHVTLAAPAHKLVRSHPVAFSGTLGPAVKGATVVVVLHGPGHRSVRVHATVGRSGTWSTTVHAPRKLGAWKAVATWSGNQVLLGDHSSSRGFWVVR